MQSVPKNDSVVLKPVGVTRPLGLAMSWCTTTAEGVTLVGAAMNVFLAALKFGAGMVAGSASLVADAGHSLSDLVTDAVCMLALRLRNERAEASCTLAIGAVLCATGIGMSSAAGVALISLTRAGAARGAHLALRGCDVAALLVAIFSVLSKEWLFRITHAVGTRRAAPTLVANAFHHRSDALSSVAAIVGVGGAMLGFGRVDLLAALMVGGMVLSMGLEVGSDALCQLLRARGAAPAAGGVVRLDEISLSHLGLPAHLRSEADADAASGRTAHDH